ncbi:MAG: TRAP transporter permease [Beijerinckiaceae bacterium]
MTASQPVESMGLVIARVLGLGVALLPLIAVLGLPARYGLFILDEQIAAAVLACGLAVVFLRMPGKGAAALLVSRMLAVVSLIFGAALFIRFPVLSEGAFFRPVEAASFGFVAIVLLVEGMRRVVGWTLTVVFALLFAYALFGHLLPASIGGKSLTIMQLLGFLGADSTALLGQTLTVACFVIVPFILFGRLLVAVGAADVFDALGARLAGNAPGASGRITIISSMLFGTVSGSAVANVMANGSVTIGMMQRNGYSKEDAAAAEAVSSTGGQIMPPVMGAAAFIMAEYLKVPYATIMLAALLPAMLFYGSILCQLDFTARRMGLPPVTESIGKPLRALQRESSLLALAFVIVLGGIFWYNLQPELAAVLSAAMLALIALVLLRGQGFTLKFLLKEVSETGLAAADVLLVCALAGMIIGILTTTGLGFTLSLLLLELGKSNLFLLLVVTAAVSLILGMGMPTTAVYMLLATLAAPSLVKLGIPPISAHMFVFYYGLLSMITPPVALAAFAAASIAQASPVAVAWHSVRISWIAFLVPFLFIYQPAILLLGSAFEIAAVAVGACIAIPLVTGALVGHALGPLQNAERLLWLIVGVIILVPVTVLGPLTVWVEAAGFIAGLLLLGLHAKQHRVTPAKAQ